MKKLILIIIVIICTSAVTHIALDGLTLRFNNSATNKSGVIYYSGDSLYAKTNDSTFIITSRIQMGCMYLISDTTTNCINAGQYYKVIGRFRDGANNNFLIDSLGKITFKGIKGTNAIGVKNVNCTSNKSAMITYAVYMNGTICENAELPIDINNPNKTKAAGCNRLLHNLKSGDYFEVYVKSSEANTTVTTVNLYLTFNCDR